jgi:hypothetical protein
MESVISVNDKCSGDIAGVIIKQSGGKGIHLSANAKLSYPDQAHKLWSDVDGKEKLS